MATGAPGARRRRAVASAPGPSSCTTSHPARSSPATPPARSSRSPTSPARPAGSSAPTPGRPTPRQSRSTPATPATRSRCASSRPNRAGRRRGGAARCRSCRHAWHFADPGNGALVRPHQCIPCRRRTRTSPRENPPRQTPGPPRRRRMPRRTTPATSATASPRDTSRRNGAESSCGARRVHANVTRRRPALSSWPAAQHADTTLTAEYARCRVKTPIACVGTPVVG